MKNLKQKPMYRYLMILTICSAVGLQSWLTLFNNFAVEVAGLEGIHIGVIQSLPLFWESDLQQPACFLPSLGYLLPH